MKMMKGKSKDGLLFVDQKEGGEILFIPKSMQMDAIVRRNGEAFVSAVDVHGKESLITSMLC